MGSEAFNASERFEYHNAAPKASNLIKAKTTDAQADAEIVSASAWAMWISYSTYWLCSFPNLIENFRRKCRLVLG